MTETEQARARDEAGELQYLELLLEHAPDGIAVIDSAGHILSATPSLERMLGNPEGTLVGVDGLSLIHPDDLEHVALRLAEYVTGGNDGPDVRTRLRRADGTYAPVELVAEMGPDQADSGAIVLTVRDMTNRSEAAAALRDVRILHEAVASVAALFVDAKPDDVDACIDSALALVGEAAAVDRAYVFAVEDDLTLMTNTHEWCAPGIAPEIANLQAVELSGLPRWRDTLARGHSIHIRRVNELDADWTLEREELERQGVRSVVAVPLMKDGRLRGFVGLDSVLRDRTWDDDTLRMLRTVVGLLASVRDRCDAQRDMAAHEARYRALVQHSTDTVVLLDADGRLLFSAGDTRALGFATADSLIGMSAMEFVHPDDLGTALAALHELTEGARQVSPFEIRIRSAHGTWVPVEVTASNLLENPAVGGFVVGLRDITDRHRAEQELRDSESRLRTLVKNIPGAVYRCEPMPPYRDLFVSEAVLELTGHPASRFLSDEVLFDDLILPGHAERTDQELQAAIADHRPFVIEYPIRHGDGNIRWVLEQGQPFYGPDGRAQWLDGVMFDVTERKLLQDRLTHDAAHDPLTDLPNRTSLLETLEHALKRASRTELHVAVLFIDLDRFKLVNDALGHAAGDELLISVAQRLRATLRASDVATRTGGDEFVVVCTDLRSPVEAEHVAHRIALTLSTPFSVGGREVFVSASIGIAVADALSTPTGLVRDADAAAYRAKERGRNRYEVFDEALRAETANALETESALHRALDEDQLLLHFQPLVDLRTHEVLGFEGLLRWEHPTRGLIGPAQFLDAAEASGLVVPIGYRTVEQACAALAQLDPTLSVAVNLSPRELAQQDVVDRVRATLRDAGVDPRRLCLEITESALLSDADLALNTLARLKDTGVSLAIDDFGTGYSSLNYLRRLPVDVVKIDRSFVAELGWDGPEHTIIAGIIGLTHGLGLEIVAEGIETQQQAQALLDLGCTRGHGFLYSPARPLEDAGRLGTSLTSLP
jgi:diguanylate cyclase (GGDEF)-like protein/PAS domain S-box-containing protein